MKRRFLVGFIAGILTTIVLLVIGVVVFQHISPSEERSEGPVQEPYAGFPSFFVSDSSLTTKTSHEISVKIIGKEGEKGVPLGSGYCIAFPDGRWSCGETDGAGNTHRIYTDGVVAFNVYSGDYALDIWNRHVQGKPIELTKPNCSQLPHTPSADATDRFQCEGL